jgi:AcrR family transcriptional regulator
MVMSRSFDRTIPIGMEYDPGGVGLSIPTGMVKKKSVAPTRSRVDWEEAALSALAVHGPGSMSIPDLARSLGVTKGSFYWHFQGIRGLIAATLERWEEMDRVALEEVSIIRDPRARLTALFVQSMEMRKAHDLYVALAGSSDPEVAASIRRISERRLQFLFAGYRDLGLTRVDARAQALLTYTAYVGALHLRRQGLAGLVTDKELAAYVSHAVSALISKAAPRTRKK